MMDQVFDPLNLLILAVAVVVFLRLRSVLGKRTGTERPPFDPYAGRRAEARTAADEAGNVVTLPPSKRATGKEVLPEPPAEPVWKGFAEAGSPVAAGLEQLAGADKQFNVSTFLEGAKVAYEIIILAFGQGDRAALKDLVSKDVFDSFSRAIEQRDKAGETVEQKFVSIDRANILAADMRGRKASITVRFVSELITTTRNKAGEVVGGDPKQINETTDVWTFERDVSSRDPNWKLVATEAPG